MKWADKGGGTFEQPPVGTHVARCIRIIDIGTQTSEYQGAETIRRQCIIFFELPNELMTHGEAAGKPFIASKFYTQSLNEKATLRKDLVNWRGREFTDVELEGFEPKNILDKTCLLSITANEIGKTKISGIMALPKGTPVPRRVNELVCFFLDEFDAKTFDSLSEGIKKMIVRSPEYHQLTEREDAHREEVEQEPGYDTTDEVPF